MLAYSNSKIKKGKAGQTGRPAQGVWWVLPPQERRGSADVPGRGIAVAQLCSSPSRQLLWQRQEVISCSENPEGNLGEVRVRISPFTIERDV